ncbi:caspase family protein [Alphaproteobacteria bacterium]|nr:caspase family protein [Alphaproteobacteria bacterium]
MMTSISLKFFLVGLIFLFNISEAFASVVKCTRTSKDNHGYSFVKTGLAKKLTIGGVLEDFDSMWPKAIELPFHAFMEAGNNSKSMLFRGDSDFTQPHWFYSDQSIRLLPSGKGIGTTNDPTYSDTMRVTYQCDMTSHQLRQRMKDLKIPLRLQPYDYFACKTDAKRCSRPQLCSYIGELKQRRGSKASKYISEAKKRGFSCGWWDDNIDIICSFAVYHGQWLHKNNLTGVYVKEAKKRGLSCGAGETMRIASSSQPSALSRLGDVTLCNKAVIEGKWDIRQDFFEYVQEAKRRGLSCGVAEVDKTDGLSGVMQNLAIAKAVVEDAEKKRREKEPKVGDVSGLKATSAALTAAEKEAERLRQRVAALEAEKAKQQQTISNDTKLPTITIASVNTQGKQGIVRGRVKDNTGIAEVTVDGTVVPVTSSGNFEYSTFVPSGGLSLKVQATDLAGLTSMMSVTLERNASIATAAINFDRLNPTVGKRVKVNNDALALIVGVADYENTPAKAIFADSDAMMFRDYASEKLGIPESRIKTLVNDGADIREVLLGVKRWLSRASKQGKSDVYVFFAGHGLASDDGQKMYLLPYDGAPELLDDTAILRDRLFSDIASANPRSVTVFLDTCYSGTTRGTDMLIASRPIAIKALKQSIPENFTVMTAARGDQTAKPLEEAKHGMFSYFLMKGMEGEADKNRDNKITAGELHQYVQQNVVQQSSGSQTPELQGDAERVLVRFQ